MATTTNGGQTEEKPPQLNVLTQQINVNAKALAENDFEVELKLEGRADTAGTVLFSFDLSYAGVFRILNVPQENIHPLVMIECPRLLFPFAREIIAAAVRNGGFPPLLLDPVDFVALYRQRMSELQAQQAAAQQPS
jgi:preprotein translocase subunit SecB